MNLCAIWHQPLSNYAYAVDEQTLVLRLRTAKNDTKGAVLFFGDRVCKKNPIELTEVKMEKVASDTLFDYYEAMVVSPYTRVCYYFYIEGEESYFYSSEGITKEMGYDRDQYFQFPYIRREDLIDIPEWANDLILYQIFPDSFASGKGVLERGETCIPTKSGQMCKTKLGGTLKGIMENVEYIASLGVNGIYLNPIFAAGHYHKYDTIDYYEIDPCFGTKEDLKQLVKKCHKHGIRVILDGVFNHCGAGFFAFQDVLRNQERSLYKEWFYRLTFPVRFENPPDYETFAYVKEMPKLNTGNPEVLAYFCEVGRYWIKEADIDGWRLDVANEVNHDFWRVFRKTVRQAKKDTFLIGEIWGDAESWLIGDQFDSVMNYSFLNICRAFFAEETINASGFDERIQRMRLRYPHVVSLAQMNLLDSHDVPRFLTCCGEDKKKAELAFFYLMMSQGIPSIFYGDEKWVSGRGEADYRQAMPWGKAEDGFAKQLKKWIDIRKEYEALRKGDYKRIETDDEQGIYVFARNLGEQRIIILLHNKAGEAEWKIPVPYQNKLYDLLEERPVEGLSVMTRGMEGMIFKFQEV
ncbi:MAG: alpha-glycosidase [Lachnospiraceae bacterium]|nr:alpha-glycosidase [Lachnospiraceae bacterium]